MNDSPGLLTNNVPTVLGGLMVALGTFVASLLDWGAAALATRVPDAVLTSGRGLMWALFIAGGALAGKWAQNRFTWPDWKVQQRTAEAAARIAEAEQAAAVAQAQLEQGD